MDVMHLQILTLFSWSFLQNQTDTEGRLCFWHIVSSSFRQQLLMIFYFC